MTTNKKQQIQQQSNNNSSNINVNLKAIDRQTVNDKYSTNNQLNAIYCKWFIVTGITSGT